MAREGRREGNSDQNEKSSGANWQREGERKGRGISSENKKGRGRGIATRSRRAEERWERRRGSGWAR